MISSVPPPAVIEFVVPAPLLAMAEAIVPKPDIAPLPLPLPSATDGSSRVPPSRMIVPVLVIVPAPVVSSSPYTYRSLSLLISVPATLRVALELTSIYPDQKSVPSEPPSFVSVWSRVSVPLSTVMSPVLVTPTVPPSSVLVP